MRLPKQPAGVLLSAGLAALEYPAMTLLADEAEKSLWMVLLTGATVLLMAAGLLVPLWLRSRANGAKQIHEANKRGKEEGKEEERDRQERQKDRDVIETLKTTLTTFGRTMEDRFNRVVADKQQDHSEIWKAINKTNSQVTEDRHVAANKLNEVLGPINLQLVTLIEAAEREKTWQRDHDKKDDARFAKLGVKE